MKTIQELVHENTCLKVDLKLSNESLIENLEKAKLIKFKVEELIDKNSKLSEENERLKSIIKSLTNSLFQEGFLDEYR